jgi:hypothetical protein
MTCPELRSRMVELSRDRLLDATARISVVRHLSVCADCSRHFEEQCALTSAEAALARYSASITVPLELESILLVEYDSHTRVRRRRMAKSAFVRPAIITGAIAAALAGAWFVMPRPAPRNTSYAEPRRSVSRLTDVTPVSPVSVKPKTRKAPVRRIRKSSLLPAPADDTEPFVAIPYTIPLDPRERAAVVRMEMPVAALTAVGLRVAAPDASANAQADVIIGEDGRIRAIRLLSISSSNPDRSMHP